MGRRGDLRLILQSINAGWDTSPENFRRNLEFVRGVMDDPQATHRELLTAVQICMAIESQNIDCDDYDTLLSQAKALGRVYEQAASLAQSAPVPSPKNVLR